MAYKLLLQETCPSWIYSVKKGATTIWERWNSIMEDGSIIDGMNSFNHYSYGAIGDWLYRSAVGIRETAPVPALSAEAVNGFGLTPSGYADGYVRFTCGSGKYEFEVER